MKYRIYNLAEKKYCGDSFFVGQSGEIIEIINAAGSHLIGGACNVMVKNHSPQDFIVEPSTGFIVKSGQKIFVGDILRLDCFSLDYEVLWKEDRFKLKALYKTDETPHLFPTQKELIDGWVVAGTIHD